MRQHTIYLELDEDLPYSLPQWQKFVSQLPQVLDVPPEHIVLNTRDDRDAHQVSPGSAVDGLMLVYYKDLDQADELFNLETTLFYAETRINPIRQDLREKERALDAIQGMPGEAELHAYLAKIRRKLEGEQAEHKVLRNRICVLRAELREIETADLRKVYALIYSL